MKGAIVLFLAALTVTTALSLLQPVQGAVTCGEVDAALIPCVSYLTGRSDSPSRECCSGVSSVKKMAQTTADKREACRCVKAAAIRYTDLKDEAAENLPAKCGVSLDIPISRSVDCDKAFREGSWEEGRIYYRFMNI